MTTRTYPPRPQIKQEALQPTEFLSKLTELFSIDHGSAYLTQKRLSQSTDDTYTILFRATNRKSMKIATQVDHQDLPAFLEKYAETCRSGMSAGLKKRDRKAKQKKRKV